MRRLDRYLANVLEVKEASVRCMLVPETTANTWS